LRFGLSIVVGPIVVAAITAACVEPGAGALYPDAQVHPDAAPYDVGVFDAFVPILDATAADARSVLPDAAPPPWFPFSGIFRIVGAGTLFAREVDDHLSLIVDGFPNVYTGTVTQDGTVTVRSATLVRSGCANAEITGRYIRDQAFHNLQLTTCDGRGNPISSGIEGGFDRDFASAVSGVYELTAVVAMDIDNCARGPRTRTVRYGFSFDGASGAVAVFTTSDDVIADATVYIGNFDRDTFALSALFQPFSTPSSFDVSMSGRFEQNDPLLPPRFIGQRDVLDVRRRCGFTITLDGRRIERP